MVFVAENHEVFVADSWFSWPKAALEAAQGQTDWF